MLEKKKPDAPEAWKQRLPDMATRLEQTLYRESSSLVRALFVPHPLYIMLAHVAHTPLTYNATALRYRLTMLTETRSRIAFIS